jgi:hypothetical protein
MKDEDIFVPHYLAKKLKKKNFNWPCIGFYFPEFDETETDPTTCNKLTNKHHAITGIDACTAPTYDQVVGWFRRTHNIDIGTVTNNDGKLFAPSVNGVKIPDWFITRQSALRAAITEALKIN